MRIMLTAEECSALKAVVTKRKDKTLQLLLDEASGVDNVVYYGKMHRLVDIFDDDKHISGYWEKDISKKNSDYVVISIPTNIITKQPKAVARFLKDVVSIQRKLK